MKALLALALLAGCSSAALGPAPSPGDGPTLAVSLPGSGVTALARPVATNGGVTTWQTAAGEQFSFRDGHLIRTGGLGADLSFAGLSGVRVPCPGTCPAHVRRFTWWDSDLAPRTVTVRCRIAPRGRRELDGTPVDLLAERCGAGDLSFLNLYWIDEAGRILQSRQWAGTGIGPVTFRRLDQASLRPTDT